MGYLTVRVEGGESGGPVLQLARQVQEAKLSALHFRKAGFLSDTGRGLARDPKTQRAALDWIRRAEAIAPQRMIRMIKIRQKVSGCLRTLTGAQQFCAIRSYLATTAKHGIGLLDALTRLTNQQPWLPSSA